MTHQDGGVERKAKGHPEGGTAGSGAGCAPDDGATDGTANGVVRSPDGRYLPGSAAPPGVGAPVGNTNAPLTSGLRSKRALELSRLPAGAKHIQRAIWAFRRWARREVQDRTGQPLTVYETAVLQSACRHETRSRLAARWLRELPAKAAVETRLALLKTVSDASDARDKCLQRLSLDRPQETDPWTVFMRGSIQEPQETPGREMGDGTAGETDPPAIAREAAEEKRTEEDRP